MSEERVEHARLQTFGSGHVPRGEPDHFEQVRAASKTGKREPASGPLVPVEGPERRRAALENLDVDGVLTRRPLGHAHQRDRGGETAAVWRDAVEHRLPGPHGRASLPDHPGLLRHPHPTEVAEGPEALLLQGPVVRETEQDGDDARNRAATEELLLQLS